MATTRALLVEDHTALRQALGVMLEREPGLVVVNQAGSVAEARGMLEGIDLAVVDLQLPDGTGVDVISELLERNPRAAVLVLTGSLDRELFGRAVEAGAAGVIHKTAGVDEVVEAVRKVRAGEQIHTTAEVIELMRLGSRRRERDRMVSFAASSLTPREQQILEALADGLTSQEIADRLGIARETEHAHMVRLFSKLGVHSRVGALAFGLRHGLVDHGSPADPQ